MIVRKIVPRVAVCAVILADRSPLALGEVWPPTFPVNFAIGACLQPLLFGCHSNRRKGVQHCIRWAGGLARCSFSTGLQRTSALLESRLPCILVASNLRSEAS